MYLKDYLGILITGKCNKNCKYCVYGETRFNFVFTEETYQEILKRFHKDYTVVVLGGGEPMMYDGFNDIVLRVLRDFPKASVLFRTNGRLLPTFNHIDNERVLVEISHYPGWNDDIVAAYSGKPRLIIIPYKGFTNCDTIEPFSEPKAKEIYEACDKQTWVKNGRVYECCASIIPEMKYDLQGVSVPVEEFDYGKLAIMQTWKSCQYCLRAHPEFETQQPEEHW